MSAQQLARRNPLDVDGVFYFPFDSASSCAARSTSCKPRLFVMVETEIWPNLLRECRRRGVKTVIVNGRISSRSFPRYRLARGFFRRVLADVDRFCVQSDESARRFIDLGAAGRPRHRHRQPEVRLARAGQRRARRARASACCGSSASRRRGRCWWRAARMKGEEALGAARLPPPQGRRSPAALLVLAPRHPERFAEVEALAQQEGFRTVRRTELPIDAEPRADVVVLDTIGELAAVYQVAHGSCSSAAASCRPAGTTSSSRRSSASRSSFGPHMQNFTEIAEAFVANDAGVQVPSEGELEDEVLALMADPVRRARLGAAARALVEANRGAKAKTLAALDQLLPPPSARPNNVRPFRAP